MIYNNAWRIVGHGSIVLFEPLTETAQNWWNDNVDPECMKMGAAYAVEHRYAGDIAEGIREAFNEQKTRASNGPRLPAALAMASGSRPKLQATSRKLQATSRKLDKGPVLCYRIFKEKEI